MTVIARDMVTADDCCWVGNNLAVNGAYTYTSWPYVSWCSSVLQASGVQCWRWLAVLSLSLSVSVSLSLFLGWVGH